MALDDVLDALFEHKAKDAVLQASFDNAAAGFNAQKALLLAVDGNAAARRALAHKGLRDYEVIACEAGRSVAGVSTSCIAEVVETGRVVVIQDTSSPGGTLTSGALSGCYSVLCAPIVDATGAVVAALYLQNDGVRDAFGESDVAWMELYARVLGRVMNGAAQYIETREEEP